jgi:hypothetical protein
VSRRWAYFPRENTATEKETCALDRAGFDVQMQNDTGTVQDNSHKIRIGCSAGVPAEN